MPSLISGQNADANEDALFDHYVTTEPDPLTAGQASTEVCVRIAPKTDGVYCSRVTVDLKAPGLPPICSDLTNAEIEIVTCPDGPPWTGEIDDSRFSLYYENDEGVEDVCHFSADDTVAFNIINLTPDAQTGDTGVRVTELSTPDGQDPTEKSTDHYLTRTSPGTVFRGFGPFDPKRVVIARDEIVTLTWEVDVPDYHPGPSQGAHYTVTLSYNEQTTDVTTSIDPTSGKGVYTTPPLGTTTLFTLTLTLYPARGTTSTHTQQAFIIAAPTDLTVNDLTVTGPTRILNRAVADISSGTFHAGTDGLLHCQITKTDNSPCALQITPHGMPTYTISTSAEGLPVARLLLPIPKDTYVTIERPQGKNNGTYECVWHPLGTGPLSYTRIFTTTDTNNDGNVTWTVPDGIEEVFIELWGPGGTVGHGGKGGYGGAGAYLNDTISVIPGGQYTFHIGKSNDHTRVHDPSGQPILLAAGGGHGGGGTFRGTGGAGGAGAGYPHPTNQHVKGGAPGGQALGLRTGSGGCGGYNDQGGQGGDCFAVGGQKGGQKGGDGWGSNGQDSVGSVTAGDFHQGEGAGGAGPGSGRGGNGVDNGGGGGGGAQGGIKSGNGTDGGGAAGGGGSGGCGGGAGGNGWGWTMGKDWGANGAGGGGGGYHWNRIIRNMYDGGGGGGSQGWSYLRDPGQNGTFYDGGQGIHPAGNPPNSGIAIGGVDGPAGDGAVRVTWIFEPDPEEDLAHQAHRTSSA